LDVLVRLQTYGKVVVVVVGNVHDVLLVVVVVVLICFTGKAMTGGNREYLKCHLDLPNANGRNLVLSVWDVVVIFLVGGRHMAGYFKF